MIENDPFHAGRVLGKYYLKTTAAYDNTELSCDERMVMNKANNDRIFSSSEFSYPTSGLLIWEIDVIINSLISKGLVRQVKITLP